MFRRAAEFLASRSLSLVGADWAGDLQGERRRRREALDEGAGLALSALEFFKKGEAIERLCVFATDSARVRLSFVCPSEATSPEQRFPQSTTRAQPRAWWPYTQVLAVQSRSGLNAALGLLRTACQFASSKDKDAAVSPAVEKLARISESVEKCGDPTLQNVAGCSFQIQRKRGNVISPSSSESEVFCLALAAAHRLVEALETKTSTELHSFLQENRRVLKHIGLDGALSRLVE